MKDKPIIKMIASLVTIIIMGVIIFFIYDYYDKEAKKGNSIDESEENELQEEKESNNTTNTYKIIDYDKNKEIVMVGKKKVVIEYQLTDAGNVITLNDESISYVPYDSKIKYVIANNNILFYIENYESVDDKAMDLLIIADNKGNVLKTYSTVSMYGNKYIINEPLINDKIKSSISIKNNKLYLTYIINDLDDLEDDEIIQFSYEFDLDSDNLLDKETLVYKYNYSNYTN